MFNPIIIEEKLSGLIGFRQHHHASYDRLDADIVATDSGIVIDSSAHSLLTIENISAIAENFSKTDVAAYASNAVYQKGDVVKEGTTIYRSLQAANTNHLPSTSSAWWVATNLLSAYLYRLLNSAAINLFSAVFAHRKLYENAKTLLTDVSLYDGVGNLSRKVTKLSRFVGFRINPKYKDTVINITWTGFQFDTANPAFELYVFHSSQSDPIKVITGNISTPISFCWKELSETLALRYNSSAYNDGGYFYIGYYEDDLIGQAIWKEQGFSGSSCSTCNTLDSYLHKQWGKFLEVQPFYVEEAYCNHDDKTMFDEDKVIELNGQNWGLNFKLQVVCDVTDLIVRSKMAFADAMRKQVVHDLLRDMAFSLRDNQRKEKVAQLAHYALENKENNTKGAVKELEEAIKTVSFDVSSMSSVCLPCSDGGNGVIISSVF